MNFSQHLSDLLVHKNHSQAELARFVGVKNNTVSDWINKGTSPKIEHLYRIAEFFNVSYNVLMTGEERSPSLPDDELELLKYYKELPDREQQRLIGRASALAEVFKEQVKAPKDTPKIIMTTMSIADVAAGAGVSTPFTIDNAFSPKEFPSSAIPSGADCGVPINGDSMEPNYPNGSIVWVKFTDYIQFGDVVIATLNGEPYCKIYKSDGLHSFNENYEPIHVNEQDNFSIFGKVIGYYEE